MNLWKNNPLLFKYFLSAAFVFLISVALGLQVSKLVMHHIKHDLSKQEITKACQIIQQIQEEQKLGAVEAFQKFMHINPEYLDPHAVLFNQSGQAVFIHDQETNSELPSEFKNLSQELCAPHLIMNQRRTALMRLSPEIVLMVSSMPSRREFIAHSEKKSSDYRIFRKHPMIRGFLPEEVTALILVIFLIGGFALSTMTALFLFRKASKIAGATLEDLKNGNLKSRFLINGRKPAGVGAKFNEMADEIEKLVEHLRVVEDQRTKILQELAHDLKTPVASLRGLLESLRDQGEEMSIEEKNDFLNTSISETLYFSRLVEDLLFISGVTHPQYKMGAKKVDLAKLIEDEIRIFGKQEDFSISLHGIKNAEIVGEELLLKRLIRNAIDNAVSFADSKVRIELRKEGAHNAIYVIDNGPGILEKDIQTFGKKRATRRSDDANQGRISLGLGSVIMMKIAQIYGGEVSISNGANPHFEKGTTLKIQLQA